MYSYPLFTWRCPKFWNTKKNDVYFLLAHNSVEIDNNLKRESKKMGLDESK